MKGAMRKWCVSLMAIVWLAGCQETAQRPSGDVTAPGDSVSAPVVEAADTEPAPTDDPASRHVYYSRGVHNDYQCDPPSICVEVRKPDEPSDPQFPVWWTSEWTMYRVFSNYETWPPPYASPPDGLTPDDYEVSYGASYYDSTYVPADGDGIGAMMEHYQDRCLPIFPSGNHYTCSFVSLGNKAWFLRYDDRPSGTPACCQFSLQNHPPRRDFIKHLPYSPTRSAHLGGAVQAYALTVPPGILFGYAFWKEPTPDSVDTQAEPYRHPQSFYFSGSPTDPPNAPIVSQNYTNFRMQRPDPARTWDQVAQMCPATPEWCCLFDGDCPDSEGRSTHERAQPRPSWAELTPPPHD